jgi:hypothetical protein
LLTVFLIVVTALSYLLVFAVKRGCKPLEVDFKQLPYIGLVIATPMQIRCESFVGEIDVSCYENLPFYAMLMASFGALASVGADDPRS